MDGCGVKQKRPRRTGTALPLTDEPLSWCNSPSLSRYGRDWNRRRRHISSRPCPRCGRHESAAVKNYAGVRAVRDAVLEELAKEADAFGDTDIRTNIPNWKELEAVESAHPLYYEATDSWYSHNMGHSVANWLRSKKDTP